MFIILLRWSPLRPFPIYDPQISIPQTLGPSSKGYQHCSLSCKPQKQAVQDKTVPLSQPWGIANRSQY